jgi:hypothetical protein
MTDETRVDDWPLVSALVRRFRQLPLEGDAGCDKLTDDEWRMVARAAIAALTNTLTVVGDK